MTLLQQRKLFVLCARVCIPFAFCFRSLWVYTLFTLSAFSVRSAFAHRLSGKVERFRKCTSFIKYTRLTFFSGNNIEICIFVFDFAWNYFRNDWVMNICIQNWTWFLIMFNLNVFNRKIWISCTKQIWRRNVWSITII